MSIRKQYLKSKPVCRVTFKLAEDIAQDAGQVNLVGEFNNWDKQNFSLKRTKGGEFSASLELDAGKEYEFKYLIDGKNWLNDPEADKFVPNEFQGENSVIVT